MFQIQLSERYFSPMSFFGPEPRGTKKVNNTRDSNLGLVFANFVLQKGVVDLSFQKAVQ